MVDLYWFGRVAGIRQYIPAFIDQEPASLMPDWAGQSEFARRV
jgi:hypothetical protein